MIEGLSSLQEQLQTHKKSLREVDDSIKRLNVTERSKNHDRPASNRTNSNDRVVRLNPRNASNPSETRGNDNMLKRKTNDDDYRYPNKRNNREHESAGEDDDHLTKHTVKSSVVSTNMPIKSKEDLIKLQNKFSGSEQRNRRIFGHILGTLRQFKSDDKERSSTTQAIHRKELEKKIEIKKIEEKKKIAEEKKKLEEEKYKETKKIEIIEQKIQLAEEFEVWKTNQLKYKKFIRTNTKPFIFYMPKELDEKAEKLLQETAKLIDDAISKKLKEVEGELEALTKQSNALYNSDENKKTEDKENKKSENTDDENDELDEEKNINVRIGDEDDEEINTSINKTSPNDTKASNEDEENMEEEHAKLDTC